MNQLSGGQKSLVAMALIFAIQVKSNAVALTFAIQVESNQVAPTTFTSWLDPGLISALRFTS